MSVFIAVLLLTAVVAVCGALAKESHPETSFAVVSISLFLFTMVAIAADWRGDRMEAILDQIERTSPGVIPTVVHQLDNPTPTPGTGGWRQTLGLFSE
jgi:putative Ca2+/H+ antiporter (TMEM165/GDT1 family)